MTLWLTYRAGIEAERFRGLGPLVVFEMYDLAPDSQAAVVGGEACHLERTPLPDLLVLRRFQGETPNPATLFLRVPQ